MSAGRLFRIISILLLLAIVMPLLPPGSHLPIAHAASETIHLVATSSGGYYYWNSTNPTITVTQGDTITLYLSTMTGSVSHTFWLDLDNDGVSDQGDCSLTVDPCISTPFTTPQMLTFTANTVETVTYFCTIHSYTMTGSFKVQAPLTPTVSMVTSPTSLTFQQGSSSTSTITLTSQNGFSGTVSLYDTSSPTGLTTSFNPSIVAVSSGATTTSTLSLNSTVNTPSGSYIVTVMGETSGTIYNTTTISVTVNAPASADFSLAVSSTSQSIAQGSSGTEILTVTSQNDFYGWVDLAATVNPSTSSGPAIHFSPATFAVSRMSSQTSTLTVYAVGVPNGNYSVNVTATSGSLTHSMAIQVTVGSTTSSPAGFLNIPPSVLAVIVIAVVAVIALTIFLIRRRGTK